MEVSSHHHTIEHAFKDLDVPVNFVEALKKASDDADAMFDLKGGLREFLIIFIIHFLFPPKSAINRGSIWATKKVNYFVAKYKDFIDSIMTFIVSGAKYLPDLLLSIMKNITYTFIYANYDIKSSIKEILFSSIIDYLPPLYVQANVKFSIITSYLEKRINEFKEQNNTSEDEKKVLLFLEELYKKLKTTYNNTIESTEKCFSDEIKCEGGLFPGNQSDSKSYLHAMAVNNEINLNDAKEMFKSHLRSCFLYYYENKNSENKIAAYEKLGVAIHGIQDSFTLAHTNFQNFASQNPVFHILGDFVCMDLSDHLGFDIPIIIKNPTSYNYSIACMKNIYRILNSDSHIIENNAERDDVFRIHFLNPVEKAIEKWESDYDAFTTINKTYIEQKNHSSFKEEKNDDEFKNEVEKRLNNIFHELEIDLSKFKQSLLAFDDKYGDMLRTIDKYNPVRIMWGFIKS